MTMPYKKSTRKRGHISANARFPKIDREEIEQKKKEYFAAGGTITKLIVDDKSPVFLQRISSDTIDSL